MGNNVIDVKFNEQKECLPIIFKSAGPRGGDGKSAYEQALEGGYTGTEEEFNNDLKSFSDLSIKAEQGAQQAVNAAQTAQTNAQTAQTNAQSAQSSSQSAQGSAQSAAQSAQEAAQSAAVISPDSYVKKSGDTMTGRLSMGANDILFQNPDGGTLLQIATDGSNWDLRGDATWLRFNPSQFGLTLRDMLGEQDFYNLLHTKNFAPDYANKINFAANGEENTAVKAGYVFVAMDTALSGNPRECRTTIKRNGVEVFGLTLGNSTNLQSIYAQFFPVIKGDVYSVTCYNTSAITCYFIPLLGA